MELSLNPFQASYKYCKKKEKAGYLISPLPPILTGAATLGPASLSFFTCLKGNFPPVRTVCWISLSSNRADEADCSYYNWSLGSPCPSDKRHYREVKIGLAKRSRCWLVYLYSVPSGISTQVGYAIYYIHRWTRLHVLAYKLNFNLFILKKVLIIFTQKDALTFIYKNTFTINTIKCLIYVSSPNTLWSSCKVEHTVVNSTKSVNY